MYEHLGQAFDPVTKSVYDYYQDPGVGLYIPLYQREYSWDKDNIDQLLDDLARGVDNLITSPEREIRFLGTIIAVKINANKVYPLDPRGLPAAIENIIDGQQRLSTIAIFSTLLFKYIDFYEKKLKAKEGEEELISDLKEACNDWKKKLLPVFSLNLGRGKPELKPKIIRGNKDQWTKDGKPSENYHSEVASYLASFIDGVWFENKEYPPLTGAKNNRVLSNLRRVDRWLRASIIEAHISDKDDFAPAWDLISRINEEYLWMYERPELAALTKDKLLRENPKTLNYSVCVLLQLFSVTHYLLERCCFTIIQPMNEDWAFDMFQSLNATGTPLTAIETFKPMVVNVTDAEPGEQYFDSDSQRSFQKVDALFKGATSAAKKNKLANELLTSFALAATGTKLATHFSKQRKYLDDTYTDIGDYRNKVRFIHFFGNYANFYDDVWSNYRGVNGRPIQEIANHPEADLASLIVLFLIDNNHKMAITVLASFYSRVLDGTDGSTTDFVKACKIVGGFYVLWRSSDRNAGLDNVYRSFFKTRYEKETVLGQWEPGADISIKDLREHILLTLDKREIASKEDWKRKARNYLGYDSAKGISRFALFVSAHETMPDEKVPGLMKKAKSGSSDYLNLKRWVSDDLKTVEHIAPQDPKKNEVDNWDDELYRDEDKLYDKIGNLTLLPGPINASVSNRSWLQKYLYFQHLAEKDESRQKELHNKASNSGVDLSEKAIELLQEASYKDHIASIVTLGEDGKWTADVVSKRTERILDLLWDKVHHWISS